MKDFEISTCILHNCTPDWSLERVWNDYTFWQVVSGAALFECDSKVFRTEVGDSYVFKPGVKYKARKDSEERFATIVVHFDIDTKPIDFYTNFKYKSSDPFFNQKILLKVMENMNLGLNSMANKWFTAFFNGLHKENNEASKMMNKDYYVNNDQSRILTSICEKITKHPEMQFSITELASKLHVSSDHFTRLFKSYIGLSPKDFIINVRLNYAKGLLLSSSYTMERIADLCGYKNHYFFSRQFKAKTGMSPSHYRLQN
jgi:AraC-like DNA-binding protein